MIRGVLLSISVFLWGAVASAGEVTVAVASNFVLTAETLAEKFRAETGHDVALSHGATGALYAQIVSGAPFDVFLAADTERPARLAAEGLSGSPVTYAIGRLVLVASVPLKADDMESTFAGRRVALADPLTAPYGLAALKAMERMRLDTGTFQPLLVSNVGQVAALFSTGNAELAFVSAAQLERLQPKYVLNLDGYHPAIRQDAVLLKRAAENEAADAFWAFLQSDEAQRLIAESGYTLDE